jgi:hypothetical protein
MKLRVMPMIASWTVVKVKSAPLIVGPQWLP